ncbi:arfaptin-1 isoform X11 [Bubalus kerabau]|uniref:arfaptin-1 isoform X11 n=1 Tax=Bubalus carabanensis TaxID=3119969 RepID=UPI00244EDDBB|nr:arfaptin-1 isoform X11 [Bubalus carabanensis]XP_055406657.1 arfaptin-1 isoform X11 [Bubalus carabanensis]
MFLGGQRTQTKSGPVILADETKNPAMEKLELVRKWSLNTYKCTRQIISEKLGRGSRTVDLELEAQIDILRDNKKKYENILKLAQTLSTQLFQMVHTQRQLGDAFADLSLKSLELHEEFGYNADTQKLLAKNGETLLGAINFFIASVNTLVNKTIEDTLMTVKQYESARIEYDAYRTDLEELNLGPRDANTLPKIEQSQHLFQAHKEKYDKMRNDVSIKLKFLEENKDCPFLPHGIGLHSVMSDSATPWTVTLQAAQSMGFSRQEYWSGLPFLSPGDLPDPGMKPRSPVLQAGATREATFYLIGCFFFFLRNCQ